MSARRPTTDAPRVPVLHVQTADGYEFRFTRPFHVGRGDDCEIRIQDNQVSRKHLRVSCEDGRWSLHDLQSGNGVFIDDRRVTTALIDPDLTVSLGQHGPTLQLSVTAIRPTAGAGRATMAEGTERETVLLEQYRERYFGSSPDQGPVGHRTMVIRKAYRQLHRRQRRLYVVIVALFAIAAIVAGSYAYIGHRQLARQKQVALDLFYTMKALDLDIANLERIVAASKNTEAEDQIRQYRERRRQLEADYDQFLTNLGPYNRPLTEQERLILRVTRMFGECELAAPPEYIDEVGSYIRKWQSTDRFAKATTLAQERGYTKRIADEFLTQNLPPQFFYLAMQESNFNAFASGPLTSWGYAKGMWQFIPDTAQRYGLAIGPLSAVPKPDAADDRHKWDRATVAAARYIKDIYSTDAQASGLLVMASYNWGEGRVIRLVRSLTANPRERNFWKLLERYRNQVPKETYDYVFLIVAAAVIGENPRLFGMTMEPPLGFLEQDVVPTSAAGAR